jgi:hypothetical protein
MECATMLTMQTPVTYRDWRKNAATPLPRLCDCTHKDSAWPITAQKEGVPGDTF